MNEFRRLDLYFQIGLYVIIALPFLMVLAGGGVSLLIGGPFIALLVLSWFSHRSGWPKKTHTKWWNAGVLVFIAFTLLQLFFTATPVLDAALRLVLVLILIKMFSRLAERDDLQVMALSFLLLAAATTVNEDLTFGILFGFYVLAGTLTLAVFHLRSELAPRQRLLLGTRVPLTRQYMGILAGLSMVVLAASLAIFFLFPRIGFGFFVQQARDGLSVTGFNDEVQLGQHGTLRDNPKVVMRVEFPETWKLALGSLHWRAMAFDHYDGKRWSRTLEEKEQHAFSRRGVYRTGYLHPNDPTGPNQEVVIYLEPIGTNILPVLWPTEEVKLGSGTWLDRVGPRSGSVTFDNYGDLRHTYESELGVPYTINVGTRATRGLDDYGPTSRRFPPKGEPREEYLQVPPMPQRFADKVEELTAGKTESYQKVEAIEAWLNKEFTYTTDLPDTGDNPIDGFLFEAKRGHCEYFATSTVLMLRQAGVHARLVNGFLGGRWNDVGGYLAVRQGDAHSWVEYWSDEMNAWVPTDPTPASDMPEPNPIMQGAREIWDAGQLLWMKWVIEYDLSAQVEVFKQMGRALAPRGLMKGGGGDSSSEDEDSWRLKPRDVATWGGYALIVLIAFFAARRRRRRGRSALAIFGWGSPWIAAGALWIGWFLGYEWIPTTGGGGGVLGAIALGFALAGAAQQRAQHVARKAFDRVAKAAKKSGVEVRADEGPGTFLDRLAASQEPELGRSVRAFKRIYLKARFSSDSVSSDDLDALDRAARKLASSL